MVYSGIRNFCFRNRVVSEMLGAMYGLSKKLRVEFLCDIYKRWNFWTEFGFFEAKSSQIYGREWLMCVITVN